MKIRIQTDCIKRYNSVTSSLQFWGFAGLSRQADELKNSLMAELHGRPDIECIAGTGWCLVCEKGEANNKFLASSRESALHAAVAGKVWSLSDDRERDAQLVVKLYKQHVDSLINQCDGQFAAVIFDEKNGRAVLTVNWPGGFHWLYYCTDGDSLAFATRLDLLIHRCGWRAQVNEQAVVDLLRFGGLVSERSLLQGVNRVIPGFAVVFEEGRATQQMVYQYPSERDNDPSDTVEIARFHREAVQRRISDYDDFGLFLSGGLDSGLNVAVASKLRSKPIKTFNVAFDSNEFDESPYARLVASRYNTKHFEVRLDTAGCLDRLPEMVWAMQEPISDYSYIPTFYVAEAIRKHVDVAIGGDGPDHFLGRNYQYAAWYNLLSQIPFGLNAATWFVKVDENGAKIRQCLWQYARRKRIGRQLWQSLACASVPCGSGMLNNFCNDLWGDVPPNDLRRLLSSDLVRRTNVEAYNGKWVERWQLHQACGSQYKYILSDASLSGLCGVFVKVGAMCSAHNLTIHEPYLAAPLLRYFCGLKDSWRVDGNWLERLTRSIPTSETKRILRRVATGSLPQEVVLQKEKHGFEPPLIKCWRQSTSGITAQHIFGALLNGTDWFDHEYLERLVREMGSGARDHRYMLLLLAALDQWFRIFIQGNATAPTWRWSDCF